MKSALLLLESALLLSNVAAQSAFVWTVDAGDVKDREAQATSVSTETASYIVARRLGLSSDRYLGDVDDVTINELNDFGGYQAPLFNADVNKRPARLLIRISGVDYRLSEFEALPDLWVEQPARDLLYGFHPKRADGQDNKPETSPHTAPVDRICEHNLVADGGASQDIHVKYMYTYQTKDLHCGESPWVTGGLLKEQFDGINLTDERNLKSMRHLLKIVRDLAATENIESTILLLPSELSMSSISRRSAATEEEQLELQSSTPETPSHIQSSTKASNSSHPLPSIIPLCFSSKESCNNITNSCSGVGSCYQAYRNCFKCKCGTSVAYENESGSKKTVEWGGNACQKKDVSVPFFLFASIGVLMTALVTGGLGLLYSMGAQELPSVLGAGVSGPRAQR